MKKILFLNHLIIYQQRFKTVDMLLILSLFVNLSTLLPLQLKFHVVHDIAKFSLENASFFIKIFLEVFITCLSNLEFFFKQLFLLFNVFNFHDMFFILLLNSPSLDCAVFSQYNLPLSIFLNADEF